MRSFFLLGFAVVWGVFAAYWFWTSRGIKQAKRSESSGMQFLAYWLPLAATSFLLVPGPWFAGTWLAARFLPDTRYAAALSLALAAAGIALCIWARTILGRNWSSVVQVKEGHDLIEAGPYAYIRHPIYTGLLMAFLGSATAQGEWRGLLAVAIVFASFWRKLRLEERWLGEAFGEKYADYRRRTKALVPGIL